VREAVSNAVRHADATTLTVNVTVGDDLCIEVIDDGKGIADDVTASGLTNLNQRAHDAGGSFTIEALPTRGTKLRWCAPLP
jgi:signal transduction histidine kinase